LNGGIKRSAAVAALSLAVFACALTESAAGSKSDKNAAAGESKTDKNAAATGNTDKDVVAEIGGQKISMQEMDDFLHKTNGQAFQAFYDARRAALDQLIAKRLMESEAAARKVTVEKLQQDVVAGIPATTDADVEAFYNQNKGRMGAATLDQAREQITGYLAGQKQGKAMADFIADLKEKNGVRVSLQPPRSELRIAEDDPGEGPKDAPVQLIEFSDFQ